MTGYRPLRLLAVALANAGYPTLRFDYPNTGNSRDTDADDVWQLWQDSIQAAIDWLRYHDLADQIVLCGLRAGATLATGVCSIRRDIIGLLLLEPVLRGRSYLRQLSMEAGGGAGAEPLAGSLAVHELMLSTKTVQRMSRIDLRLFCSASLARVGVFSQGSTKLLDECLAAWRGTGMTVDVVGFDGLEAMLRPVLMSHLASVDASSCIAWLNRLPPAASSAFTTRRLPAMSKLLDEAFVETAMRFGTRQSMFGILCEPAQHSAARVAVVITNSSGNPTSGFGRFGVELARSLAAANIASLRIDFTGVGDSVAYDDHATHIFEVDRREELRSAVDLLIAQGYRQIAIQGLCSGAYHALHGAFADPRIGGLLLVNLQHFLWDQADRVELKGYALRHPSYFLKRLGSPALWVNLFRGKLDLTGIAAVLLARLYHGLRRVGLVLGMQPVQEAASPGIILDRMRTLSLRAKTLFLMSEGDEGIAVLASIFGPALEPPGAVVEVIPGLDHALSSNAMRRVVIERSITFLENQLRSKPDVPQSFLEVSLV